MCTVICDNGLVGRTLDLEYSYNERIVITPRGYRFSFVSEGETETKHAIIGVGIIRDKYPLYYEGTNEAGISVAGLNFPGYAFYSDTVEVGKHNLAPYELIPWVLCRCESIEDATELLQNVNIISHNFSFDLPSTPLHWMITDGHRSLVLESTKQGCNLYHDPYGIMTNSPSYPYHCLRLADYMGIGSKTSENKLCPKNEISLYSRGLGACGLPGDFSSSSRFVRGVFLKNHTIAAPNTKESIGRIFHILDSLSVPLGAVVTEEDKSVRTVYATCADVRRMTYYYVTYNCRTIFGVELNLSRANSNELLSFPMDNEEIINLT